MRIPCRIIAITASIGLGATMLVATATSAFAGAGAPLPKACDTANVWVGYTSGGEQPAELYIDGPSLGGGDSQDPSLTITNHAFGMTASITPWVDRWTRFSWSADRGVKILGIQVLRSDWGPYPKVWGLVNHSFSTPPGVAMEEVLICAYNPALPKITARG